MPNPLRRPAAAALLALLAFAPIMLSARDATPPGGVAAVSLGPVDTTSLIRGYEVAGIRWEGRTRVEVYYNWDGGSCVIDGTDLSGPAASHGPDVALRMLDASIADINLRLRGGLTLVNAGPTGRADLCSRSSGHPIVVGYGTIASAGVARYYGSAGTETAPAALTAARVYVNHAYDFACAGDATYRDLQHVLTHELLHAIGVGHSADATAIMAPSGIACSMATTLQPDDVAALAAIYPPPQPPAATAAPITAPLPAPATQESSSSGGGSFDRAIASAGVNTALWTGGSLGDLGRAAMAARGVSVTVFVGGAPRVYVPGAPAFVNASFQLAFPDGVPAGAIVLVVQ